MKKIGILILLIMSSTAFANESFQEELQLPQAHYSQAQKKVVVQVVTDEKNNENYDQQARIINTLQEEAQKPVEVKEVSAIDESQN